jgi:adenylate cyclase
MPNGPIVAWIRPRLYHLLSPLVALVLVGLLDHYTDLLKRFEYQTVNLRFQARSSFDPPADPRIVFVTIDEFSLDHIGKWPWSRGVEADFLKQIGNAGMTPTVVSFDVMFTEESDRLAKFKDKPDADTEAQPNKPAAVDTNDQQLGEALSLFPSITGALTYELPTDKVVAQKDILRTRQIINATGPNAGPTQPLPNFHGDIQQLRGSDVADFPVDAIRSQSLFAFVNDNPSPIDDIRHTIPLVLRVQDKVYASLSLQTLCQMLQVDADKVEIDLPDQVVRLKSFTGKSWTIPVNEHGEFTINYRRQESFRAVSFGALLQNVTNHLNKGEPIDPACEVDKKSLFFGETATALADMGPSPLSARSPLPYAHLNVINNVLKGDYLTFVPWWWVVIGWLLVTYTTLIRVKDAVLAEAVAVPIMLIIAYTFTAFAIFAWFSIQIALVWPIATYVALNFGGVVLRWREERKGREQIKQIFSKMVSPEVMNHLMEHPENMELGGSDRMATVLFSDIRGYTKFSEGLETAEVVRQLNIYFDRMVGCVNDTKGTLHKFIGDAIMAAWGDIEAASQGEKNDATNAVTSALMMRQRLRILNEERKTENLTPIKIGVGLNYGVVQAGMLGSAGRMEFTVMGDTVNTASRLEGLTKEFKTDLAISESVKQLVADDFIVRRLGLIVLMGKSEATMVYEVLATKNDPGASRMSTGGVVRYEEAFDHFLARRFKEAEALFVACAKDYPDDHCVKTYLAASREFLVTPPLPDWDGRIVMTTK